jgi:hypothetical protein
MVALVTAVQAVGIIIKKKFDWMFCHKSPLGALAEFFQENPQSQFDVFPF